jgi:hypothetical protein
MQTTPVEHVSPSTPPLAARDAPAGQPIHQAEDQQHIDAGPLTQPAQVNPHAGSPRGQQVPITVQSGPSLHEGAAEAAHDDPATAALLSKLRAEHPSEEVSGALCKLVDAVPPEHRTKFVEVLSKEDPQVLGQRLADLAGADPVAASRAAFAFIQHAELSAALPLGGQSTEAMAVFMTLIGGAPDRVPDALSSNGISLGRELACDALALLRQHSPRHAFWLNAAPSLHKISGDDTSGPLRRAVEGAPEAGRRQDASPAIGWWAPPSSGRQLTLQARQETALGAVAWWMSVGAPGDERLAALGAEDAGQAWNAALSLGIMMASSGADQQQGVGLQLHAAFERAAQGVSAEVPGASAEDKALRREIARDGAFLMRQHAPANAALKSQVPAGGPASPTLSEAPGVLRCLVEALPPDRQRFAALTLAFGGPLLESPLRALRTAPNEVAASAAFGELAHHGFLAYGVVVHGSEMTPARQALHRDVSLAEQALHADVAEWPAGDTRFELAAEARELLGQCIPENDPAHAVRAFWRSQQPSLGRADGPLHERVKGTESLPASERLARILDDFRALSANQESASQ